MAGKVCPKCEKNTFFITSGENRKCSNPECGCKMTVPPHEHKGGRGEKCSNCRKFTVFKNVCSNPNCGARYS